MKQFNTISLAVVLAYSGLILSANNVKSEQLSVQHDLFFSYPRWAERANIGIQATDYTTLSGRSMLQLWLTALPDRPIDTYIRRSEDNGKTWDISKGLHIAREERGGTLRHGNHLIYLDRDNGLLVLIYWQKLYVENPDVTLFESVTAINSFSKIYLQISRDGGISWEPPQQIIQNGKEFDTDHWARDVDFGRLSGMVAGMPHMEKTADGTLLLPFQVQLSEDLLHAWKQGVFMGKWKDDLSGIEWELGEYVEIPQKSSSRGALVGTIAELKDGPILMIMRGKHTGKDDLPGEVKWSAVSTDGGQTWAVPAPIKYDDESIVWSASSNSRLFRAAGNGRLYFITHFLDEPKIKPPRRPLQIAEVDEKTFTVKKDTVTLLTDRVEGMADKARFEIRGIYNDRENGNIVMFVQGESWPGTAQVFRHEVIIP